MKTYDILKDSSGNLTAVKIGFNAAAFFFTWIWALVKGLFVHAVFLFALGGISSYFLAAAEEKTLSWIVYPVFLVICFIVGAKGNDWVRNRLIKKGYEMVTSVDAANSGSAIATYQAQQKKETPA
jgi:hypothetical protein